ncbi:MAG: hypothetical protein JWN45_1639 [Acidobacteriaceae bacterium]|jgi:hypothetical protein|nr:hypothetical protein [Acidobacteriaceae bacterium]
MALLKRRPGKEDELNKVGRGGKPWRQDGGNGRALFWNLAQADQVENRS